MTGLSPSPLGLERQKPSLTANEDSELELEREKELTSKILERAELAQMTRKLKLGLSKVPTAKLSVSRNSSPRKRRSPQRVIKESQSNGSSPVRRLATAATLVGNIHTDSNTRRVSSPLKRETQIESNGRKATFYYQRESNNANTGTTSPLKREMIDNHNFSFNFNRYNTAREPDKNQKYITSRKQDNTQLERGYLMTPMASTVGTKSNNSDNSTTTAGDGTETGADLLMYLTTSPFASSKEISHNVQTQEIRQHTQSNDTHSNNTNENNSEELEQRSSQQTKAFHERGDTLVAVPTTPSSNVYGNFAHSSTTHNDAERLSHMKPSIGSPQSALKYANYGLPHSGSAQLAGISDDILLQSPSIFLNTTEQTTFQTQHGSESIQEKFSSQAQAQAQAQTQTQTGDHHQEVPKTPSQDQVPNTEGMPSATFSMLNLLKTPNFNFGDYIHSIFSPSPKVTNPTTSALRKPNVPSNKLPSDTPETK